MLRVHHFFQGGTRVTIKGSGFQRGGEDGYVRWSCARLVASMNLYCFTPLTHGTRLVLRDIQDNYCLDWLSTVPC